MFETTDQLVNHCLWATAHLARWCHIAEPGRDQTHLHPGLYGSARETQRPGVVCAFSAKQNQPDPVSPKISKKYENLNCKALWCKSIEYPNGTVITQPMPFTWESPPPTACIRLRMFAVERTSMSQNPNIGLCLTFQNWKMRRDVNLSFAGLRSSTIYIYNSTIIYIHTASYCNLSRTTKL